MHSVERRNQEEENWPMSNPTSEQIREFWEKNPLCANLIPHPLGSEPYFQYFDLLREGIESVARSYQLHEYRNFKGKRVLDVGAGNGYVLGKYAVEGAVVSGIDITPTAIDLCEKRFRYARLRGDFRIAQAEALPYEDQTFDCVCSMGVLHHVSDTKKAIAEIFRVLKPGGRLIVMFYHRHSLQYLVKYRLNSWLQGKSMEQLVNEFDGVGNPRGDVYSRSELAALLGAFADVRLSVGYLTGDMVFPRGGRFLPNFFLKPLAPMFGWNLYAKAWKPALER
jgi:ubiquinone/menaquinone biosynthesis C-methylase UbiE